jgi:hypothetical protein
MDRKAVEASKLRAHDFNFLFSLLSYFLTFFTSYFLTFLESVTCWKFMSYLPDSKSSAL